MSVIGNPAPGRGDRCRGCYYDFAAADANGGTSLFPVRPLRLGTGNFPRQSPQPAPRDPRAGRSPLSHSHSPRPPRRGLAAAPPGRRVTRLPDGPFRQ